MSKTNDGEAEHGGAPVPRLLRIGQLAELLGVSVRYLRRLVQERRIPFIKMGHYVMFEPSQVTTWLEECRRPVQEGRRPGVEPEAVSARSQAARQTQRVALPLGTHRTVR